jgi:Leucine-rich repeat (LRR) protein
VSIDFGKSKITSIGQYSFACAPFTGVLVLPSTLTTLSRASFCKAANITSIDMSNTKLTSIPQECFYECESMMTITFADNIAIINQNAFFGCESLTGKIILPTALKTISAAAFLQSGYAGTGF